MASNRIEQIKISKERMYVSSHLFFLPWKLEGLIFRVNRTRANFTQKGKHQRTKRETEEKLGHETAYPLSSCHINVYIYRS